MTATDQRLEQAFNVGTVAVRVADNLPVWPEALLPQSGVAGPKLTPGVGVS